ncbi:MAG TPA: L,D-transpeptidase family protein [Steroidobacteraceae bacterium]|nr:L,D-transpeptidase family protein [Steroidobacteraceae bacterium]
MNRWPALALIACGLLGGTPAALGQAAATRSATVVSAAPSTVSEALRERVDLLRYGRNLDVRGQRVVLGSLVAQYYETQHFQPDWVDPSRLDLLLAAIGDLRWDGLNPEDYHLAGLQSFRGDLRNGRRLTPVEQADLEVLAMDAMMLATYHLYAGKVNPDTLSSEWNFASRPAVPNALEKLGAVVDSGHIREAFEAVRPQHPWYQRGRERLKEYRAIEAAGGWPRVPDGPTLKPGMTDARVVTLRQRLRITHDLVSDADAAADPAIFDAQVEQAVRHFQARHGLTADGAVGAGTRAALNVPVSARIDQIRINLERGRWVLHEMQGRFVLVDVAGFRVTYFENDQPQWTSKVIVGRPYRETPIFKSLITYVVFNPTWTIPPTILAKDKLPILKKDPGYLARNNIRVLDSAGREVDPHSVNWSRYSAKNLPPYQFRQDPGEDNALGLVKIMFPNPHMVYLHDTPTKSLFDKDQRTFSSGCIRVEKAFELAERVLGDEEKWNPSTMAAVVASKKMQTVYLAKPVPVLLLYWTAEPTSDGQEMFRNDIYGRDAATLAALNSSFRTPPRLSGR